MVNPAAARPITAPTPVAAKPTEAKPANNDVAAAPSAAKRPTPATIPRLPPTPTIYAPTLSEGPPSEPDIISIFDFASIANLSI